MKIGCYRVLDDPDSGVLEELGTGSESSSLPQSPKAVTESSEVTNEDKRFYSREQFLHENIGYESNEYYEKSHRYETNFSRKSGTCLSLSVSSYINYNSLPITYQ